MGSEIQERIKRRSWVRIQQCVPQPRLADFADGQILSFVPGITKTHFPVPSLEIIAKFSHLTTQPNVEQRIPVSELFMSGTGVVNAAKPNPGSHRETASVRKEIGIVASATVKGLNGFWIGTLMPEGTKAYVSAWDLEWIGNKRHSCKGRIEK